MLTYSSLPFYQSGACYWVIQCFNQYSSLWSSMLNYFVHILLSEIFSIDEWEHSGRKPSNVSILKIIFFPSYILETTFDNQHTKLLPFNLELKLRSNLRYISTLAMQHAHGNKYSWPHVISKKLLLLGT